MIFLRSHLLDSHILLSGSLAFDVIFSLSQDFRSAIPLEDGKIRNFNASYTANDKKEFAGGNAGNIAFWLGEECVPSTIFSAWGKDIHTKGYRRKLENMGVSFRGSEGAFTAHAYMVSDPLHQQLIIWQPNAYALHGEQSLGKIFSKKELLDFRFAVFSAADPETMRKHLKEFRECNHHATVFFDPGHSTPLFLSKIFQDCSQYASILIGNDIEFQHFRKLGILKHLDTIETLGAQGVRASIGEKKYEFPAIPNITVVETTGAGDAFRAGLLSARAKGKSWQESLQKGIELGAKCVGMASGQRE